MEWVVPGHNGTNLQGHEMGVLFGFGLQEIREGDVMWMHGCKYQGRSSQPWFGRLQEVPCQPPKDALSSYR